jgi:transmembrane sensor
MSHLRTDIANGITDQMTDEAGDWDARLRSPDCTDDDRARFDQWRRANPMHQECFDRLQVLLASLRENMARADIRALRDAALRAERPRTPRKTIFAAAATLGVIALVALLWTTRSEHFRHAPLGELARIAGQMTGSPRAGIYETGTGQRSITTLRDGSSVELDAETRIEVIFTNNTRRIDLIRGQAFFHVAHERRPFMVRAADREITAVGTQFDVRLDATAVRVTLIEGKVKVSGGPGPASGDNPQAPTLTPQMPASYLLPGQQFIERLPESFKHTNSARAQADSIDAHDPQPNVLVHTVDVSKVTSWRNGRIFLDDLPLTDAIAEMNRHSPVQIRIADPELAAFRVNGMFHAGDQEAFVAALKQYFPIEARSLDETEIVLTLRR